LQLSLGTKLLDKNGPDSLRALVSVSNRYPKCR